MLALDRGWATAAEARTLGHATVWASELSLERRRLTIQEVEIAEGHALEDVMLVDSLERHGHRSRSCTKLCKGRNSGPNNIRVCGRNGSRDLSVEHLAAHDEANLVNFVWIGLRGKDEIAVDGNDRSLKALLWIHFEDIDYGTVRLPGHGVASHVMSQGTGEVVWGDVSDPRRTLIASVPC